eukprot:scpid57972/ scgid0104/ 
MGRFSGKKYEVGRRVNAIRMDVSCRQYNNNKKKKKKNARDQQSQRRSQETSDDTNARNEHRRLNRADSRRATAAAHMETVRSMVEEINHAMVSSLTREERQQYSHLHVYRHLYNDVANQRKKKHFHQF